MNSQLTTANAQSMKVIRNRVQTRLAQGFDVTLQGDFNYKIMRGIEWRYGVDRFLGRDLKFFDKGLDWILWSDRFELADSQVFPRLTETNPSDHPYVIVNLVKA